MEVVVLLPVKPPAQGKSRLHGVADATRRDLATAFALDAATAALAATRVDAVVAVTADPDLAARLRALGCAVTDDVGGGLNPALRHAAAELSGARPVALLADVPALLADDLDAALGLALDHDGPAFVVDADGTGSTLYTAPTDRFTPAFGAASAAAHRAGGAWPVPGALTSLRRDVDDLAALRAAAALGLGARTRALLDADPSPGGDGST